MPTVAEDLEPLVRRLCGGAPPIEMAFWDGSRITAPTCAGDGDAAPRTRLVFVSPLAVRRLLWRPGELGLARAYVAGDVTVEGDIYGVFSLQRMPVRVRGRTGLREKCEITRDLLAGAHAAGALGPPPPAPAEEARLGGRLHSLRRDAAAIGYHYDVPYDFYRLVLGESMTYSCAYFPTPDTPLVEAQQAKYDLICRKLGLGPGMRLLDVGCGWGGMVMHAAREYGVRGVGVTISRTQVERARRAVMEAGLEDLVEIRLQDYREVTDGPYDAVASIGMVEHVGADRLPQYFACLYRLLRPGGRLLNHQICALRGSGKPARDSFMARYVFPDGQLYPVGRLIAAMQAEGFEARDAESLREHYALTLRHWVGNLEAAWDDAVRLAGAERARVWRLYMAGSAVAFENGHITVQQILGVRPAPGGDAGMPLTRAALLSQPPSPSAAL